jgi:hypothetical protein
MEEEEEKAEELSQAELNELAQALINRGARPVIFDRPGDTLDEQDEWYTSQSHNVAYIDYNPLEHAQPNNDEYMIYMLNKSTGMVTPYPYEQAKELFPALIAWHIMATTGRQVAHPIYGNPILAWTVDYYDVMTQPFTEPSASIKKLN